MNKRILVTGGSGFVGSWIVKGLLEKGYTVRITVRNKSKNDKYAHLTELAKNSSGELEVYQADLLDAVALEVASKDCNALIHTASPFTLRFNDPLKELIEPAVQGTENVLYAASKSATVHKVVLTSSVAAIYGDVADMKDKGLKEFTEAEFNDTSNVNHQPYPYSKVLAEQIAWEIAEKQDQWKMAVINPGFVMGPPLSANSNSESIQFIKDMLSGKMLMGVPHLEMCFVDVRDVAKAHIAALEIETVDGRHIIAERVTDMFTLSRIIKKMFPGKYPLPLMKAPKFMIYLTGWLFGLKLKYLSRNIGYTFAFNNNKSINELGMNYIPLEETIHDMIERMQVLKLIKS